MNMIVETNDVGEMIAVAPAVGMLTVVSSDTTAPPPAPWQPEQKWVASWRFCPN